MPRHTASTGRSRAIAACASASSQSSRFGRGSPVAASRVGAVPRGIDVGAARDQQPVHRVERVLGGVRRAGRQQQRDAARRPHPGGVGRRKQVGGLGPHAPRRVLAIGGEPDQRRMGRRRRRGHGRNGTAGRPHACTRSPRGSNSGSRCTVPADPRRRTDRSTPRCPARVRPAGRRARSTRRACSRNRPRSPGRRPRSPERTGSLPSTDCVGSSSTIARSRRVGPSALTAASASRPTNPPGLSSFTQKPSPASYGLVSPVRSLPHTR